MNKNAHILLGLGLMLSLMGCAGSRSKEAKSSNDVAVLTNYKDENSYFYYLISQLQSPATPQKELDEFLEVALEKDQDSNFLWNLKAYSEAESGNTDQAKQSAHEALRRNPNSADTLFLLAKIASFEKNPIEAEKYAGRAIAVGPASEEMYHFLAREYYATSDFQSAIKTLKSCVDVVTDPSNCLYYLGSIQLEQGNDLEAIEAFTQINQMHPDQLKVLQLLAEIHLKREDYKSALEMYQKIFRLTPEDVAVQVRLGWVYYQLGERDYALEVFERIQKNYPTADKVNYFLALLYVETHELDKALLAFARIPADSSFFKKSVTQQIAILNEKNQSDKIVSTLSVHLAEAQDAWLHLFLSWQEVQNENYDSALGILNGGLRRFGNDEDLLFQRALVFERQNKWEDSKKDLATLLDNYPNSAKAYNFLGYTMAERGEDLNKALAYVEKADALDPNKPHINDSLGWIQFKLGQTDKALECLHKAVTLESDEPTVLEHLGDVYLSRKDKTQARSYYQRSLKVLEKIEPKQTYIQKQIDGILKKLAGF